MIDLTQAEIDVLDSDTQRIGVFFRLATDPVIRLWLGIGDCEVGINAFDSDVEVYSGLGQLIDVPAVQQLINGVATRVVFHVSGVSADTLALASIEAGAVSQKAVALGIGIFNASWQQAGVPVWLFYGRADFVTLAQQADGGGGGITRVIELSVGSLFTSRRRRGLSYLTNQDQQQRSPGDNFCNRIPLYAASVNKPWPTF